MLNQQFSGESFNDSAVFAEFDKAVMLFGGSVCQRLKPVCVVGDVERLGPALHAVGNQVGYFTADRCTFFDCIGNSLIGFLRKILLHLLAVEYVATIIIREFVGRGSNFQRLPVGKFL